MDEETKKEIESLRKEVAQLKHKVNRNCANCACVSRYSCGWTVYECSSANDYRWFESKQSSRPTPRAVDGGQAGENNGQVALPTATNA